MGTKPEVTHARGTGARSAQCELRLEGSRVGHHLACSVGWFVSLLVREEVLLAGLCERKILFRLKIYDRLC